MVMVNGRGLPKDPWHMKYYWDLRKVAWQCARCHNCKWVDSWEVKSARFAKVCPSSAYYLFDAYSSQGRMDATIALLDGEWKSEESPDLLGIFYKCNMCGACDANCKRVQDMEPLRVIQEMRHRLVSDGVLQPSHERLIRYLRTEDNMMFQPKADRGKWAEGLPVKDLTKEPADIMFHAGCMFSFEEKLRPIVRGAVNLLNKAGVKVGIMGAAETCCAGKAYELGYDSELRKFAESNIQAWQLGDRVREKTIVTPCSDCYWTYKRLYAEHGLNYRVMHLVEYLAQLLDTGRLKLTKEVPVTVTYHDPCHLGRRLPVYVPGEPIMGVYDTPRRILQQIPGVKLVEMERIKENAWCCGAGGGVKRDYPDFNDFTARERLEEARATGAQALVTACGWCEDNFISNVTEADNLKVYDILQLVERAV